MLNKSLVVRNLKKWLIFCGMDNVVANIYALFPFKILFRSIPTWNYYPHTHIKQVTRWGVNFDIHPADFSQWTIFSSQIDPHLYVAKKLINHQNKGIILDVGANCGIFGLVIAKYFQEKKVEKKVFCYEPNPRVFELLTSNLQQNQAISDKVKLFNKGLGDARGSLELQIPLRNSGAGSLLRNYESEPHDKVEIEISTLDIELLNVDQTVDFIKIDVENYEYFVLNGSREIIQRDRPVIFFEVGPGQLQQVEMFQFLNSLGYQFFQLRDHEFVRFNVNPETYPWFNSLDNITAIHSDSAQSIF